MEMLCDAQIVEWYERAKTIMKLKGLSQADIARRIEESESNVSRYFAGIRNQDSIMAARKIANALGVSLDHLILGHLDVQNSNDSDQIKQLLEAVRNILTVGSPGLQAALTSNIIQFSELLELREDHQQLREDNDDLKERVKNLEKEREELIKKGYPSDSHPKAV